MNDEKTKQINQAISTFWFSLATALLVLWCLFMLPLDGWIDLQTNI